MMSKVVEPGLKKRVNKAKCHHHWVIESPDGPTSIGICKYCGAVKEFSNFLPFSTWEDYGSKQNKRQRPQGDASGTETDNS